MRRRSPTLFAHTTRRRAHVRWGRVGRDAAAHRVAARDRARVDARLATRMADRRTARAGDDAAIARRARRADAADSDDEFFGPGATPTEATRRRDDGERARQRREATRARTETAKETRRGDGPKRAMTRAEKMKEAIRKGEGGGEGGHRQRAAGKRGESEAWVGDEPEGVAGKGGGGHEAAVG